MILSVAFIFFVVFVHGIVVDATPAKFSNGQCVSLPSSSLARFSNPCVKVVDYPFYLFQGQQLDTLQNKANSVLNNTFLLQDTTFAAKYVSYVCASIYLKCSAGVDVQDVATYDPHIYQSLSISYSIPFQRPCLSVCMAMLAASSSLSKILFGLSPNVCTTTFDYSFGDVVSGTPPKYDVTNDNNFCFVPTLVAVGGPVEKYIGGYCDGVADQVVIPPMNLLSPVLTLLQEPGTAQTIISMVLNAAVGQQPLPVWLSSECRLAMRQYACLPLFAAPEHITVLDAINYSNLPGLAIGLESLIPGVTQSTIIVPTYPSRQYCDNFLDKCGFILQQAGPLPDCAETLPNSLVQKFPTARQAVGAVHTAAGMLYFPSDPNNNAYFNATEYGVYEPKCPKGYVYPDHPDDPNIQWIPNSACANGCKSCIWTDSEWKDIMTTALVLPLLGTIGGALCVLYLIVTKEWMNYYLMTIYAVANLLASCASLYIGSVGTFEENFCYDNAVNSMQEYGSSPCIAQAVILFYTVLISCTVLAAMVLQWTFETLHWKQYYTHPAYYSFQFFLIFLLTVIPVIYNGAENQFGFSKIIPFCFILPTPWGKDNEGPATSALPIFIVYCITYIVYLTVAGRQVFSTETGSDWKQKLYHCLCHPFILVLIFSLVVFVPYIYGNGLLYSYHSNYEESFKDWTKCVFLNFDGTDESFLSVCGEHASIRPDNTIGLFLAFTLFGQMLLIGPVFIVSHIYYVYGGIINLCRGRPATVYDESKKNSIPSAVPAIELANTIDPAKAKEVVYDANFNAVKSNQSKDNNNSTQQNNSSNPQKSRKNEDIHDVVEIISEHEV